MDPYKVLGIPKNASFAEIRQHYISLARKYHPDKNKDEQSIRKFQDIEYAYRLITNPDSLKHTKPPSKPPSKPNKANKASKPPPDPEPPPPPPPPKPKFKKNQNLDDFLNELVNEGRKKTGNKKDKWS
jgi:DnaJ-class molecular chaperone